MFTSTAITHTIQCAHCQLNQFPARNGRCRRCHQSLNVSYLEFSLPRCHASFDGDHTGPPRALIGTILRELRAHRGLTQELLSRYARISRSQVSRFECNRAWPSLQTLLRIAATLGIDHLIVRARDTDRNS